jgi:hypothetical protein
MDKDFGLDNLLEMTVVHEPGWLLLGENSRQ